MIPPLETDIKALTINNIKTFLGFLMRLFEATRLTGRVPS